MDFPLFFVRAEPWQQLQEGLKVRLTASRQRIASMQSARRERTMKPSIRGWQRIRNML